MDFYRAVDNEGESIDFVLTAHREMTATRRFFDKAIRGSNAPDEINNDMAGPIIVCQVKYRDNIVELDHRAIKFMTRSMLGFKLLHAVASVLALIELMHMIRMGQFAVRYVGT